MELNSELDRLQRVAPILVELVRAEKLHPNYPQDMYRQYTILAEEVGEVAKAVLHYEFEGGSVDNIRKELIQSAAMCIRMIEALPTHKDK